LRSDLILEDVHKTLTLVGLHPSVHDYSCPYINCFDDVPRNALASKNHQK
jgi:hypothetical protein